MTWSSARDAAAPAAPPPRLRLWKDDAWIALAGPLLVFAGHLLYGAMLPQTALLITTMAGLLVGAGLMRPRLRGDLLRIQGGAAPAFLFLAVLAVAVWSLTPMVPGGPHPVWAYLKISPGAATVDKSATLLETIKLLGLGCLFILGVFAGGSDRRARLCINALLALAAGFGIWSFLRFVSGGQLTETGRLEASFLSANTAGTVFAAAFVLASGPILTRLTGPKPNRFVATAPFAAAALLFLVCVFATASRGAFLGSAAGLMVMGALLIFAARMKWSIALLFGLIGLIALLALLATSGEFLLNRLLSAHQEFASREFIYRVHWRAFLDSPLFGYGLGSFDTMNRVLLDAETFPRIWKVRAAHNVYLAWLEQAGLLGALPMFGCIVALMVATLRRTLRRSRMTSLLFALLSVNAVFIVHGATDFALEMFSVAAMWSFLLGLQLSLAQGSAAR